MDQNNKEWLSHLKGSIPIEAQGYKISSYAVALEGWRRGLTLKYINRQRNPLKIRYSISDENTEYVFAGSRGELVTKEAIRICMNKYLTKQYLKKANVPTPEGDMFKRHATDDEIIEYARTLGYPLVIKPVDGSGGSGVIANITTETQFLSALEYVRYDLNFPEVIVERFFSGVDYRIYVIGDTVVGAFDRIPANIIGDGVNTIEKLIELKIKERQNNPALYNRPIKIDGEVHSLLEAKGYTLNTVPRKGERVFLKTKNNVSSGGDSRDVTDELSEEIKTIAINATKAIPGLVQAGIDIIVDKKNNTGVVLEINSRPSIRNHLFPMEGKARDIPKAIIDYYFPVTKDKYVNKQKPLFYFDLKSIHNAFQSGIAKEFTVPEAPTGNLEAISFEIDGNFNGRSYAQWIRDHVRRLRLNGYIKYSGNRSAFLVIAGSKKSVKELRDIVKGTSPQNSEITKVKESSWDKPIKIGFEIIREYVKQETKQKKKEKRKNIVDERNFYKKEYFKIKDSRSWRVTKPARVLSGFLRKVIKK